jgi:hypothetical protein
MIATPSAAKNLAALVFPLPIPPVNPTIRDIY